MHGIRLTLRADAPGDALTFYPAPDAVQRGTGTRTAACVLVLPGGGYGTLSKEKEGLVPALWLNTLGISAAVLHYRVAPDVRAGPLHPAPLHDAQRAMRVLRARATELAIDADRLAVWGFSAGGHLGASISVLGGEQSDPADDLSAIDARPDLAILWYPVISLVPPANASSPKNLLGEEASMDNRRAMSAQFLVTPRTPATFLFHSVDDAVVPVQGVHEYALALARAGVDHEVHVFPAAPHGMGLGFGRAPAETSTIADRLRGFLANREWIRPTSG